MQPRPERGLAPKGVELAVGRHERFLRHVFRLLPRAKDRQRGTLHRASVAVDQGPEGGGVAAARLVHQLVVGHTLNGRRHRAAGWETCQTFEGGRAGHDLAGATSNVAARA